MTLESGDVLLYRAQGFYGWIIKTKTWHAIAHCEIAMGANLVTASRDGIGVNYYPVRTEGLVAVLRPTVPFDQVNARRYADKMRGTPYGWLDLLNFVGWRVNRRGIVCSAYVTEALRAGGVPVFNQEPSELVAPFQFAESELLQDVTQAVTV